MSESRSGRLSLPHHPARQAGEHCVPWPSRGRPQMKPGLALGRCRGRHCVQAPSQLPTPRESVRGGGGPGKSEAQRA